MIGTELLLLLILFVVRSSADCIRYSYPGSVRCSGHSFDSFTNIGENSRIIDIQNSPEAPFIVDKSKNQYFHVIETLDFLQTEILLITEYGFKDFVSLSSLILQRCSIQTLKSTWFLANNNISYFDCSYNKLRTLHKSDLENLKMLTDADFSGNLLESIEPHTFSEMKVLRSLSLTDNKLKSIPTGRLPMLEIIELDHNLIDIVPANAFTEMPKLQKIHLEYNKLQKIEDGAFKDLQALTGLLLSNNFIEEIAEFTFSGLSETTLNWLDLSSNKIRRIAPGAFKEMLVVERISFANNSINELNEDIFEGLDAKVLNLPFNEIEIIGNNTFRGFKSLESLFINNNKLRSVTADIFGANLPNLQIFSLSNNSIPQLDLELFKFTRNIWVFGISSNKLQFLPEDIFVPVKELQMLFMQDNLIEELTEGQIESLKSLKLLSIEHNKLTFLPLSRDSFPKLGEMRIGGNPWQCPCLYDLQNFLNGKKIAFIKKYYFDWQCPVCVPTYFQHCEENVGFARWKQIPETYNNSSYTEQCRTKYLKDNFDTLGTEESFLFDMTFGYPMPR